MNPPIPDTKLSRSKSCSFSHLTSHQPCINSIKLFQQKVTALHFSRAAQSDSKVWELKASLPGRHFFTLFSKLHNRLISQWAIYHMSCESSSWLESLWSFTAYMIKPHSVLLRPSLSELSVQCSVRRLAPLLLLVLLPAAACPQRHRRSDSLWKFSSAEAPAEFSCRRW